ncbi:hypothetical protein PAPYR_6541 [Paratrimastix pyriformis]|uniref:DUF4200 domain-containing protein n=1 Tax=Paratrimastix pyriformis TaxID=342808 RepID=A0ABQ8UI51_9EUKA|nr:hypothetical protein PAPYR_6541 [Paratrimastix pyriformis]
MQDDPAQDSPFAVPKDSKLFVAINRERRRKKEEREQMLQMSILEKSKLHQPLSRRQLFEDMSDVPPVKLTPSRGVRSPQAPPPPRRERENVTDIIAKKRELFNLQLKLEINRSELQALDLSDKMQDSELQKREEDAEVGKALFDEYLKEIYNKSTLATTQKEAETQKKALREAKKIALEAKIKDLEAKIQQKEEQRRLYQEYKEFLDNLTPQDFKDEVAQQREQYRATHRAARLAAQAAVPPHQAVEHRLPHPGGYPPDYRLPHPGHYPPPLRGPRRLHHPGIATAPATATASVPPRLQWEATATVGTGGEEEDIDLEGWVEPIYFTKERGMKLNDIFAALEETSVELIQAKEEVVMAVENLKQELARQTEELHSRASLLNHRLESNTADVEGAEQRLHELALGRLTHLKTIEARLISFWTNPLFGFDPAAQPEKLKEALREGDRRRRQQFRKERAEQKKAEEKERTEASLARAQEPVRKRVGRPIMFRSAPKALPKKGGVQVEADPADLENQQFFAPDDE